MKNARPQTAETSAIDTAHDITPKHRLHNDLLIEWLAIAAAAALLLLWGVVL